VSSSVVELLLEALDRAYDKKSWHGPNLRGSLRGVDAEAASWRPGPDRHNVWEHAVHAAYWKYIVHRRLLNLKRGSFPLAGSNWFVRPAAADSTSWTKDLELLQRCHRELRSAVRRLRPEMLAITPPGSKVSNREMLLGVAAHDVYHAGQIQLLKRLWNAAQTVSS